MCAAGSNRIWYGVQMLLRGKLLEATGSWTVSCVVWWQELGLQNLSLELESPLCHLLAGPLGELTSLHFIFFHLQDYSKDEIPLLPTQCLHIVGTLLIFVDK